MKSMVRDISEWYGCDYSGQLVGLNSHKGGPNDYLGQLAS